MTIEGTIQGTIVTPEHSLPTIMKPLLSLAAFAALATPFHPAFASVRNSLEGRWKNGAMEIIIAPCGGETLCGKVVKASNKQQERAERGSGTHLLGFQVIDNIRPSGPRSWSAHVFLASRNLNAHGTIEQVGPDRMAVRGCVLEIICKTTHWDRIG